MAFRLLLGVLFSHVRPSREASRAGESCSAVRLVVSRCGRPSTPGRALRSSSSLLVLRPTPSSGSALLIWTPGFLYAEVARRRLARIRIPAQWMSGPGSQPPPLCAKETTRVTAALRSPACWKRAMIDDLRVSRALLSQSSVCARVPDVRASRRLVQHHCLVFIRMPPGRRL